MVAVAGEGGLIPRLFLVAPGIVGPAVADCLRAACTAGDVASLLVPGDCPPSLVSLAQSMGVAVVAAGATRAPGADGIQVDAAAVAGARTMVGKDAIVGAFAGSSRHLALEAAEAGADYVALDQNGPWLGDEPIVKWWVEMTEVPCVAFEPAEAADLDTLLPQNPDFIRPSDAMWESPEQARRIISELMQRLKR